MSYPNGGACNLEHFRRFRDGLVAKLLERMIEVGNNWTIVPRLYPLTDKRTLVYSQHPPMCKIHKFLHRHGSDAYTFSVPEF